MIQALYEVQGYIRIAVEIMRDERPKASQTINKETKIQHIGGPYWPLGTPCRHPAALQTKSPDSDAQQASIKYLLTSSVIQFCFLRIKKIITIIDSNLLRWHIYKIISSIKMGLKFCSGLKRPFKIHFKKWLKFIQ